MAEEQGKRFGNRRDAEAHIIAKAWSDETFAEALRTDPRAAIEKELGVQMPADLKVVVHEEKLDEPSWHLVIPRRPEAVDGELSDEDLALAAGGISSEPVYGKPKHR